MSARTPSRRLLQLGNLQCLRQPQPTHLSSLQPLQPLQHKRTVFGWGSRQKDRIASGSITNPILDEYLKKKQTKSNLPAVPVQGDLGTSSIFELERQHAPPEDPTKINRIRKDPGATELVGGQLRNPATMAIVLDPHPRARIRWQRKMAIREVRKGGRLTPTQFIKRTERESTSRSANMKTSIKKLGMLARQIAGKPIEDAIVQMRFSKKKTAKDVLAYLEFARDEAIVKRGMGLGKVVVEGDKDTTTTAKATEEKIDIRLKNGKRYAVSDKSQIYIQQAWVGRGPFGKAPDYRARGQVYVMRTPWTSLSVVLKEEATRVREYEQREEKRQRKRAKKVWHPLPDRPIVGQRQWFSW